MMSGSACMALHHDYGMTATCGESISPGESGMNGGSLRLRARLWALGG